MLNSATKKVFEYQNRYNYHNIYKHNGLGLGLISCRRNLYIQRKYIVDIDIDIDIRYRRKKESGITQSLSLSFYISTHHKSCSFSPFPQPLHLGDFLSLSPYTFGRVVLILKTPHHLSMRSSFLSLIFFSYFSFKFAQNQRVQIIKHLHEPNLILKIR